MKKGWKGILVGALEYERRKKADKKDAVKRDEPQRWKTILCDLSVSDQKALEQAEGKTEKAPKKTARMRKDLCAFSVSVFS